MKALFIVFHGFNEANGISKKIRYQVEALRTCGVHTQLCYMDETTGRKQRLIEDQIIRDYGDGMKGKILKRIEFTSIANYAIKENIDFIYLRSAHNANPFTIQMVRKMHQAGIPIIMEIPTYPYDHEYKSFREKIELFLDKCFRRSFANYIDRIVTFSDYPVIFDKPTIRISNGIDFSHIKLISARSRSVSDIHLIGVAEIHFWHGFDRLIRGLVNYYKGTPTQKVYFHLVGDFFSEREKNEILPLIRNNNLEKYVILYGAQHGERLDQLFEKADMGIGSLGRHRSGITHIKTLKNREYAARGLSFVYSEIDSDFEGKPYILKVPADESPVDIDQIINFHQKMKLEPIEIRNSICNLSWDTQKQKVLDCLPIKTTVTQY